METMEFGGHPDASSIPWCGATPGCPDAVTGQGRSSLHRVSYAMGFDRRTLRCGLVMILASYATLLSMVVLSNMGALQMLHEMEKAMRKGDRSVLEKPVEFVSKYAYAFYLPYDTSLQQMCALYVQVKDIAKLTDPELGAELVLLHIRDVPDQIRSLLEEQTRVTFQRLHIPKYKEKHKLWESFAKFSGLASLKYERVIFIGINTLIRGNFDYLFHHSTYIAAIAAPRIYWLKQPMMTAEGPIVLDPIHPIMTSIGRGKMTSPWLLDRSTSELEWINTYFLEHAALFDSFSSLSTEEFTPGATWYKFWGKKFQLASTEVLKQTRIVHFFPGQEPWTTEPGQIDTLPSAELRAISFAWYDSASSCLEVSST